MGNSSDRWGNFLWLAAVASAVGLALPALRGQPLCLDEHVSYYSAGAPSMGELWMRTEQIAVLPPLSHLLERAALALGGRSESAFRLPSLMAFVLAVGAAGWLGRVVAGPLCGGLTALCVAWHPAVLDEARFARCYGLVLLLAAGSTALLLKWRARPSAMRWLLLWAASAEALIWTHYLAAPLVAAQSLLVSMTFLKRHRIQDSSQNWITCGALAFIGFATLPLAPALMRLSDWSQTIDYQRTPATVLQAVGGGWTLLALTTVAASLVWWKIKPAASARLGASPGERTPLPAILCLWLLPLLVIAVLAIVSNPMLASPRYRVMIVPASAVAVSLSLVRVCSPSFATALAAGIVVGATWLQGTSPWQPARLQNAIEGEWKQAGLEMAPHLADPSAVVFTQSGLAESVLLPLLPESDRFRQYAACRLGPFYSGSNQALPIPLLWDGYGPLQRVYLERLQAASTRTVWIVGATDTDLNQDSVDMFADFVQSAGYGRQSFEKRPGLAVIRFERTSLPD